MSNEPMTVSRFMRAMANKRAEELGEDADPLAIFDYVVEGMEEVADNLTDERWGDLAYVMRVLFELNGYANYDSGGE